MAAAEAEGILFLSRFLSKKKNFRPPIRAADVRVRGAQSSNGGPQPIFMFLGFIYIKVHLFIRFRSLHTSRACVWCAQIEVHRVVVAGVVAAAEPIVSPVS